MPEYTILVILSLILDFILDKQVFKTKLFKQAKFYYFLILVVFLQTIFDNYLNGRYFKPGFIVGPYPSEFYSGIKIWHTPLENYLYGIGLVWMNLILFEYFIKKSKNSTSHAKTY